MNTHRPLDKVSYDALEFFLGLSEALDKGAHTAQCHAFLGQLREEMKARKAKCV
jgi:hypothetical protein